MPNQPTQTDKASLLDQTIDQFFEQSINRAAAIDPSYQRLWQTMHDLIRSGGKRLRPRMTLLAYQAFGGEDTMAIMPIAAAQELLHFSLLIHDDIIDRDYSRYGSPNVAGRYRELYGDYLTDSVDQTHFAHSAALLAGDLMLSSAHQLIAQSDIDVDRRAMAQQLLSNGIFEVAGGELLDTELSFMPYTTGDALKVARYKTASYSFVAPLLTGAYLAGVTPDQVTSLKSLAIVLGIAYQQVDDLLGVFGDASTTGKSAISDITEGKATYLVERAVSAMTEAEVASFDRAFGNKDATDQDIDTIRQLLVSTGAKADVEAKIKHYTDQARQALDELNLSDHYHQQFENFIVKSTNRSL